MSPHSPLSIVENEPLSKHTSFGIGGSARWFAHVQSQDQLLEALAFARAHSLPYYVLGQGSNMIATERGFSGIVLKMEDRVFTIEGRRIESSPGAILSQVAKAATDEGLSGLEWAYGIPGTIGGAVRGNAGAFGSSMASVVIFAKVIDPETGIISIMNKDAFEYRYRWSSLANHRRLIVSVMLELLPSTKETTRDLLMKYHELKKQSQPLGTRCAGSIFKNIPQEDLSTRLIPEELAGRQMVYAGWLIEHAGLKGVSRGNAQFSEKHANFIVNQGNATYDNVYGLICLAKERVYDRFAIELSEEIRYIGDDRLTY